MTKKIGVIGCGWLGLPLAETLVSKGYHVSGTTTSKDKLPELQQKNIHAFQIVVSEKEITGPIVSFLHSCSILIINIPPKLRGKGPKENYVAKMQLLHSYIKKTSIKHIVFVSSTSVYAHNQGSVTEQTVPLPNTEVGKQLLACETMFRNEPTLKTTILRFAGLIGADRHPVTMLSGRQNLSGGNAPVNLIHLNDCIAIISKIITEDHWETILNGVHPHHPTKKKYYTAQAAKRNLAPPHFKDEHIDTYKVINTCSLFLTKQYRIFTSII